MTGLGKREDLIRQIKSLLLPRKEIVLAYLYGSTAKGTSRPYSDVDIAILLYGRGILIRSEAKRIDFHVKTIAKYNDVKRLLDTQHQYLSKRLKNRTYGKG